MGKGKRNSLEQYERRGMIEVSSKIKERKLQGNYLQNLGACICRQKEIKNRSCSRINNGDIIVKFKDSISCDLVYNNRLKLKDLEFTKESSIFIANHYQSIIKTLRSSK